MSWQDLEREEEHNEVLKKIDEQYTASQCRRACQVRRFHLLCSNDTLNIVQGLQGLEERKTCTTLEGIGGLHHDELAGFPVENRVLTISVADLKRPAKYFWGVHDFVRGLRGALLGTFRPRIMWRVSLMDSQGHECLTKIIGILHRDISENNIVLGRCPGEERGT